MEGSFPEKRVFFLASWKVPRLSENLLHEISAYAQTIQGVPSIIQFTGNVIKTKVLGNDNGTKIGIIPEKNVKEVRRARFDPTCVIFVVKEDDSSLLNVTVWRCTLERDVDEILSRVRQSFTIGKNDDYLIPKIEAETRTQSSSFNQHGEVSVTVGDYRSNQVTENRNVTKVIYVPVTRRPPTPPLPPSPPPVVQVSTGAQTFMNGPSLRTVGVQTETFHEEHETTETDLMSVAQTEALKDEIQHLTKEVEQLKMVVESSEISKAEYYKRNVELNRQLSEENHQKIMLVPVKERKRETLRILPQGYDIRSYGIQTDKVHLRRPRKLYEVHRKTKRPQHFVLVNKRSQKANEAVARWRESLPTYSSRSLPRDVRLSDNSADNVFYPQDVNPSPEHPDIHKGKEKVMGYVTLPPDNRKSYHVPQNPQQGQIVYTYQYPTDRNFRSSTVVKKPIEEVYGHSKSRKSHVVKPVHKSNRQVITPYTFAVEDEIPVELKENGFVNGTTGNSSNHDSGLFIDRGFDHVDY